MADAILTIGTDDSAVQKSLSNLRSTVLKVGAAFATAFAGREIVNAAIQQEQAINALNQALVRTGEFSEEASQDLQDFASSLQDVTTVGDETTLELLALAKSFGITNEEAKELVTTAIDASTALGVDARTALEQLGGTLSGTSGRLAKFVPEVKELSQEALKSGEAIDIFARKFAGAAQGELATFDGALTQTKNIFGDLLEELGFFITRSPIVIDAIKGVGDVLKSAIGFLSDNRGAIGEGLADGIEVLAQGFQFLAQNAIPPVIELFRLLLAVINLVREAVLDLVQAFLGFDFVQDIINSLYRALLAVADVIVENVLGGFRALAEFVGQEIPSIESALEGVRQKIDDISGADAAKGLENFVIKAGEAQDAAVDFVQETLDEIEKGAQNINFRDLGRKISDGLRDQVKITPNVDNSETEQSFSDLAKSFGSDVANSITSNVGSAAAAFGKEFLNILVDGTKRVAESQEIIQDLEAELETATDPEEIKRLNDEIAKAQADIAKTQKEGAENFTTELGGFITDIFIPGAGQFVKLFLELAKDPEAFRTFIEGFVESLPEIIEAIAEAIPVIAEVLAENADKILIALVIGTIKLFEGTINGLIRIVEVAFENISREFTEALGNAGQDFINSVIQAGQDFIEIISDSLSVGQIGGSGGGQGFIESGLGFDIPGVGFANGGIVPPGFPNDSFGANLTSNEMILNEQQQANLFAMANGQGSSNQPQMITVQLVMNEAVLAEQILEINRDNRRTA